MQNTRENNIIGLCAFNTLVLHISVIIRYSISERWNWYHWCIPNVFLLKLDSILWICSKLNSSSIFDNTLTYYAYHIFHRMIKFTRYNWHIPTGNRPCHLFRIITQNIRLFGSKGFSTLQPFIFQQLSFHLPRKSLSMFSCGAQKFVSVY